MHHTLSILFHTLMDHRHHFLDQSRLVDQPGGKEAQQACHCKSLAPHIVVEDQYEA